MIIRIAGVLVYVVSAFLLTSMGGAGIVAGPVTLPLLYIVTRSNPTRGYLLAGFGIGTLTALQGGWGFGFVVLRLDGNGAALTGLGFAVVAAALFASIPCRREREDRSWTTARAPTRHT